jgi:SAM-dependent methyltransferase
VEGDPHTMSASSKWRNQIHCGWFDEHFRPPNKFDAILMLDILEHMPDPLAALRHARSLLHEDGVLIATVPALMALWTSHDDLNHHVIRYTRKTFDPLLRDGGFTINESRYLYHWTCPVKLAMALKEKWFGAEPASPTVPAAWVNHVCYGLSRLEQATISKLPMPFGSSLLAVASPQV